MAHLFLATWHLYCVLVQQIFSWTKDKLKNKKRGWPVLKLIAALFIIVFLPKSLYSQDSFNLDEFSEGLDIGDESIAPTTTEVKSKEAAPKAVESPDDEGFEKISVTGSHIKRVKGEGPSPVFTVDRAMLDQSGHNSVSDVLRDMTSSSFGGMREASGSNAAGVSSANIRGLGADKTLVLLNGKRLPKDAVTGSVDMNLIPMSAVKRIEVLKDGASAVYGSDAVAGVVNFALKKNFEGVDFNTSFETTEEGDAEIWNGSLTLGGNFADDRGNVVVSMQYTERSALFADSRDISSVALTDAANADGSLFLEPFGSSGVPGTSIFTSGLPESFNSGAIFNQDRAL